jgi:hypothetical protein
MLPNDLPKVTCYLVTGLALGLQPVSLYNSCFSMKPVSLTTPVQTTAWSQFLACEYTVNWLDCDPLGVLIIIPCVLIGI